MRSIEPVVSNLRRNLSNGLLFQFLVEKILLSVFCENIFTFPQVFDKKIRSIFKLNVFNLMK